MTTTTIRPHSVTARLLHWGTAGLFGYGMLKGLDNVNQLADPALWSFEMGFAALFLAILGARYIYMRRTRPTALPETTAPWLAFAARSGHAMIYASLAGIALSGLLIGALYAVGITGGLLMGLVIGLHEFAIAASLVIIVGHIVAALFHRLKGDGIWSAMVPIWRE